MNKGKDIVLTIGKDELKFNVDIASYNRLQNELTVDKKVSPMVNFVRRSLVDDSQLSLLNKYLDRGLALEIAGLLMDEFRGEVEIAVKK